MPPQTMPSPDGRSAGDVYKRQILAKVSRDRMMRAAAADHPGYDFEYNKGYPCPRHQLALLGYGPTAIHRRSWSFCDDLPWPGQRYVRPDPQLSLFG